MGFFDDLNEENINNEEEEVLFHSLNALRSMEVIDIKTGTKIGYIKDLVIDIEDSKVLSILIPGSQKGWFSKEEDIEIPWNKVKKAGMEVIIIDSSEIEGFKI
jgi:YlmC/YmxH family sporulation protein